MAHLSIQNGLNIVFSSENYDHFIALLQYTNGQFIVGLGEQYFPIPKEHYKINSAQYSVGLVFPTTISLIIKAFVDTPDIRFAVFLLSESGEVFFRETIDPVQNIKEEKDYLKITSKLFDIKSEKIAIFTNVFNEGKMLELWETYYSRFFAHEHLYVIDDGSTDGSVQKLHPKTNRITIPKGQFDNWGLSNFCGYFQRFLLSKYRWVIHVDCDELLATPDGFSSEIFFGRLEAGSIYCAEEALYCVHDYTLEPGLDFTLKQRLGNQRGKFGLESRGFLKPVLADVPVTWGPGYHYCLETTRTLKDLWLIHVRPIDRDRLLYRHTNWANMSSSALSQAYYGGVIYDDSGDDHIKKITNDELDQLLLKADYSLPSWLKDSL